MLQLNHVFFHWVDSAKAMTRFYYNAMIISNLGCKYMSSTHLITFFWCR